MADNAIWAVTGPEHDARMARELAWIATGGQTGIVGPESLEVLAQPTPNNTVRIMPGGMSIAATSQWANIGYTSAPWQSYMRAIYSPIDVEIGQTSSSGGRTDVVGIVVDDPEFEGTSPDPDAHQYWRPHVVRNAGNNATRPEHFASLGRPFLPLAQIRIPGNTATITDSMIHDIRFLAFSLNEQRELTEIVNNQEDSLIIPSSQTSWLTIHELDPVTVPQWATRCQTVMEVGLVHTVRGAANGEFRLRVKGAGDPWFTDPMMFIEPDHTDQTGGAHRFSMRSWRDNMLDRATSGGTLEVSMQVRRLRPTSNPGDLVIPGRSFSICRAEGSFFFSQSARYSAQ